MKKILTGIILILAILAVACASQPEQTKDKTIGGSEESGEESGKVVAVLIKGFKFVPAEVNIKVGETVVWTNEDTAPHTVESSDGTLRSDELAKDDTYSHTFTKAGKYDYICGIHPSMKGSVAVQ